MYVHTSVGKVFFVKYFSVFYGRDCTVYIYIYICHFSVPFKIGEGIINT